MAGEVPWEPHPADSLAQPKPGVYRLEGVELWQRIICGRNRLVLHLATRVSTPRTTLPADRDRDLHLAEAL